MSRVAMKARNVTRNALLGDRIRKAGSCRARMKGLLGTDNLSEGEGLWISPCKSIHSFGMRYEFDALFLDGGGRIVGIYRRFRRNRISRTFRKARGVLELPAGTVESTGTSLGDVVGLVPLSGEDKR